MTQTAVVEVLVLNGKQKWNAAEEFGEEKGNITELGTRFEFSTTVGRNIKE